ncbi:HAD domain-containing protein [Undibacterium arcticum]|uniref:HAD domain-containing protein n=1 Tax=Undibacterium arcticum TaxID=1762892 RepID=A0ABV7EY59_9BURK
MILFLDFDGVLHRFGDRIADYCRFLPRLEAELRDYPDVKIAVSSDWRKHHTLEELKGFFSADIGKSDAEFTVRNEPAGSDRRQVLRGRGLDDGEWLYRALDCARR